MTENIQIVLATLNARYAHTSLALRALRANLGELREVCALRELVIGVSPETAVEQWLAGRPRLVALSVSVWNVVPLTRVVELIKQRAPEVVVVLGGPEVSHEVESQAICALADHVVTGWGEVTFARLARAILAGAPPTEKVLAGEQPPLDRLAFPYAEYSDEDLRQRRLYVEASRGCPFRCAFCLSALDRGVWPFPTEPLLAELQRLHARGARRFTFVDRTFNLAIERAESILGFFLGLLRARPDDPVFVHVELIPDHLPERLKALLAAFPPGSLQLEIGVQTFNPEVQALISRRQDNALTEANLRWLRAQTAAHLHADLIIGLPGEDLDSFAAGFDRLVRLGPQEIQVGILKRLRGAPIHRQSARFDLRFSPDPPYGVRSTDHIDPATMERLTHFARFWDRVGNSGRFSRTLPILLGDSPCARLLTWSDWLHARLGRSHAIPLETLYEGLYEWLAARGDAEMAGAALLADYAASGARGRLSFGATPSSLGSRDSANGVATPRRQVRHLSRDAALIDRESRHQVETMEPETAAIV
ncbi:MAG: DUF4080 domain-containing protein [Sphingobacteriia bacterium]|nr:DUF4080 domain-containing protein [Sphingobacteriia bacterium]NCC38736.1 DUF4080 domain-containing protein [Gammaproteobacteria bacterium]